MEESDEMKDRPRVRHRKRVRIKTRTDSGAAQKLKHFYRNWWRYLLLAGAAVVAGILVWLILGSVMPTFERPPPSD